MTSRNIAFTVALFALAAALVALLAHARTAEAPAPLAISIVSDKGAPVLDLFQCRTMDETLFLKVLGNAQNVTAEPVRYVAARCTFADEQGRVLGSAQSLVTPEVLLPQEIASFEIVVPFDPAIRKLELSFEGYAAGKHVAVNSRNSSALLPGGAR